MIKLRAPEGRAVSLEGRPVDIADDGSVTAHPRDVETLRSHGFIDWQDHPAQGGDIETMTREQLIEATVRRTREEAGKLDTDKLRDHLRGAPVEDQRMPTAEEIEEAGTRVDPDAVTEERIAIMKRPELFAYLKAKSVSAPPPISNDTLRGIAVDTLRKHPA